MKTENLQKLHNRMAIQYAQSVMRSKFKKALEEFEQDMQRFNVDMTADIKLDISYVRRKGVQSTFVKHPTMHFTVGSTYDKSKHRNNEKNE